MPEDLDGSITQWIGSLKAGDREAVAPLWNRYFEKMVRLARARLDGGRRAGVEDEEDLALSAFESFCDRAERGLFPMLSDRDDLWKLLITLTKRKVFDLHQRENRQKRGGGKVVCASALDDQGNSSGEEFAVLAEIATSEPTPEFAAQIADEFGRLLTLLKEEKLRQIALLKMEGYSHAEIGARLGCAEKTVENKVRLIRMRWEEDAKTSSEMEKGVR
jgi:DNA-directed RNA polymerase specialized sigma24 family protein